MKNAFHSIGRALLAVTVMLVALAVMFVTPATKVATFAQAKTIAAFVVLDGLALMGQTFRTYAAGIALRGAAYVFPGTVRLDIGYGVIGELQFEGPRRAAAWVIDSAYGTPANAVIGRVFTLTAAGLAQPGGAGTFGGIAVNPKEYASLGTSALGPFAPTLVLPLGSVVTLLDMGEVLVQCVTASAIGQAAYYVTADGTIGAGAPGGGQLAIPNAKFVRYANAAAGLAVLRLTN